METSNGITPVMPVGGMDGGFGNGFMGIFGLLVLLSLINGGGGFGFGGNAAAALGFENLATSAEVQRGFDAQNQMAQSRDILAAVTNGTAQTIAASTANASNAINAIKDGNANVIREFGVVENALTALAGKQQECCCSTLRAIDGVNYNAALNTAAINANTTEQTQKILDAITGNRIAAMQAQINQLQLQQAVAGVVRYPSMATFNAGVSPFGDGTAA